MYRVRVPKLLWGCLLVIAMTHARLGFSQTSPVFEQVAPFRRNRGLLSYNPLTEQELASGSRAFPDEEGTEREITPWLQDVNGIEFQSLPR